MGGYIDRVYLRKDRVIYREIADEAVLVPVYGDIADMRCLFSLNPVARHVWLQLDGRPLSAIVGEVCEQFDVQLADAERDVASFVEELLQADLIREA